MPSTTTVKAKKVRALRAARKNPIRFDPSMTTPLQKRFTNLIVGKFQKLKRLIYDLIVIDDVFGLRRNSNSIFNITFSQDVAQSQQDNVANQIWRFTSTKQQLDLFEQWLLEQFGTINIDEAYELYTKQAMQQGVGRAFDQVGSSSVVSTTQSKAEFLRSSFYQPIAREKVELLASRVLIDLKGVTSVMGTTMKKVLMDGLVAGTGARKIASELNKQVDRLGIVRARAIARTEIVRAHAEGQLIGMRNLGVTKVGVMVEWKTVGDDRVCPLCIDLDGIILTLKEAEGMLPRHVNCRCAWLPANVGEEIKGQVRTKEAILKRINKSASKDSKKDEVTWIGGVKTISSNRPKRRVIEDE